MSSAASEARAARGGRLLAWLERVRGALAERLLSRSFELKLWNELNPKDPLLLVLHPRDAASLADSVLGGAASEYAALAAGGLEIHAAGGLRITHWRPLGLYLLGIRSATLRAPLGRGQRLRRAALPLALVAMLALAGWSLRGASAPPPDVPDCGDALLQAVERVAPRCGVAEACELGALVASGAIAPGLVRDLSLRPAVRVTGFESGSARVPAPFAALLANYTRAGGRACDRVLVLGRASAGGRPAANLGIARRRAEAVASRIAAGDPAAPPHTVLVVLGEELLPIDLDRLRVELGQAGIEAKRDDKGFARSAYQSVELHCLSCARNDR